MVKCPKCFHQINVSIKEVGGSAPYLCPNCDENLSKCREADLLVVAAKCPLCKTDMKVSAPNEWTCSCGTIANMDSHGCTTADGDYEACVNYFLSRRLNLGAGDIVLEGYENLDRKTGQEIYPLIVPDGSCHEIRASHVLEHFPAAKVAEVVRHWVSKLNVGGVLKIGVPDFKKIAERYLAGSEQPTAGYVMGGQVDENDFHRAIFDEASLRQIMQSAGLVDIQPWQSEVRDCASLPISLNLMGRKTESHQIHFDMSKVHVVMSTPRVGFLDNMFTVARTVIPLGCQLRRGTGVYWDQVLTRQIEEALADGAEYILTVDYDTWFSQKHVLALFRLMMLQPDAAAIVPQQVKRENDGIMAGFKNANGEFEIEQKYDLAAELLPITGGHFGLTLIRASAFEKLQKPWFIAQPGADGRWGEGRVDADITFWQRMDAAGFKTYLAAQVYIGHYQLVCSFPPAPNTDYKTIHVYNKDVEAGRVPSHCIPEVDGCTLK